MQNLYLKNYQSINIQLGFFVLYCWNFWWQNAAQKPENKWICDSYANRNTRGPESWTVKSPFVKTTAHEFNWNSCIHLIWCHVWIACHSGDQRKCRSNCTSEKKPITKSEWWIVISGELISRTTVATSWLHPTPQFSSSSLYFLGLLMAAVEHEGHHVYLHILMCTNNTQRHGQERNSLSKGLDG